MNPTGILTAIGTAVLEWALKQAWKGVKPVLHCTGQALRDKFKDDIAEADKKAKEAADVKGTGQA